MKFATAPPTQNRAGERGIAIAPILYLLGLIGVGAGVLFSGYSQILRSNQTMSNTMAAKNDLQGSATTLAATSWLSDSATILCPPLISPTTGTPSADCTTAPAKPIYVGTSLASATLGNLPVAATGGAGAAALTTYLTNYTPTANVPAVNDIGVFKTGSGAKVLDPWGHYYIYCVWTNPIGSANAYTIISAGPNGKIESTCGSTTPGGDDLIVSWTTAVAQQRAAVWQTTTAGTSSVVTGATFGATGTQVDISTSGNVIIPGTLGVAGVTSLGTTSIGGALTATDITGTPISGSSGSFTNIAVGGAGQMTVDLSGNMLTGGTLGAGSSTLSYATVTNNTSIGGALGVTGAATLGSTFINGSTYLGGTTTTSTSMLQVGTAVPRIGSSAPLFTVGIGSGSPITYPFSVDQLGGATANSFSAGSFNGGSFTGSFNGPLTGAVTGNVTGNLTGDQSGGSVAATSFTDSGSFASNGTGTATFAGPISATSFVGAFNGTFGGSMTGILPLANGGTNIAATSNQNLLSTLFSGLSSQFVPAATILCCIQTGQLSNTGGAGTWNTVTVGTDGRVISGSLSGGNVSQITDGNGDSVGVSSANGALFTIGSTVQGNWTTTGLMVGSSKLPVNKLDVYGAQAIGTGYAGVNTAPTNGLIVQGNVGIGTNNPLTYALDVNGTINATNFVGNGSGLTGIGSGIVNSGTAGEVAYYQTGGSTVVGTSTIEIVNGNVGIGSTSPASTLDVNGMVTIENGNELMVRSTGANSLQFFATTSSASITQYTGDLTVHSLGFNWGLDPLGSSTINLYSAENTRSLELSTSNSKNIFIAPAGNTIFSSGNVGIGTTSPQSKVQAFGGEVQVGTSGNNCASNNGGAIRFFGSTLYYCDGSSTWQTVFSSSGSGGAVSGTGSTGYDALWTSPTSIGTGLIFESGSKVGIGTAVMNTSLDVNGDLALRFGTDYSTPTGTQSNVALGSYSAIRFTGTSATTFTGIANGQPGKILYLHNASTATVLTLSNQSGSSSAANRIVTGTGADMQVAANTSVTLQYDGNASLWRVIGGSGGGIPAGTTGEVQYNSGNNTFAANSDFTWLTATNELVVGTGAATPQASTGTIASFVANIIPQAISLTLGSGGGGNFTDNAGAVGQMAYYSGATAISGTPNLYVSGSNIGIGTATATYPLSFVGSAQQEIWMQRAAAGAGNNFVIQAGGAQGGGSNLSGGNLVLSSGTSTGSGTSQIQFNVFPGTAGTTSDNTATTAMTILGSGNVGIGSANPVNALDVAAGGVHMAVGTPSNTSNALYNVGGTLTWSGTSIATGGAGGSIYGTTNYIPVFTGASTIGNSNLYQNSSSIGIGTTTPLGLLGLYGGAIWETQNGIGVTSTNGLVLSNTTAAANNAQQWSPRIHFTGQGWETGVSASQPVDFINEVQTTQSTTSNSTGNLVWSSSVNGGAYSPLMTLTNGGNVGIGSSNPQTALVVNGTATATMFSGSGASLTGIGTSNLTNIIGTPSGTTYLRGDGTWATVGSGSGTVTSSNAGQVAYFQSTGSVVMGTSTITITGGQVGIGTAVPTNALTVNGNIDAMGSYNGYITEIPNSGTATGLNQLAKMYGANTVTIGTTGDTDGMIGVVAGNAGTTGKAQIAIGGQAGCVFDSAPSAVGDFVTISSSTAGDCHDTGSKVRAGLTTQIIGQVMNIIPISGSTYPVAVNLNGPNALPNCSVGDTAVSCGTYWVCASQRPGTCFSSITLTPATLSAGTYGTSYSQNIAAYGGFSPYTFTKTSGSLPAGLTLSSGGFLTGTPTAVGTSTFTITATDSNSNTGSQAYSLTIAATTITLSPTTLSNGTYNSSFSQTITASGGIGPYTYAVTSGSLPGGVTLSSGGVLSGTPTASGSFSFTITTTDAHSYTGSQAYTWTITAPTITLSPTSISPVYGSAFSQTLTASGGVASYTFAVTSGSLPGGLSLNSSTGAISGTPSAPGAYSFTVTATDAHSQTGSQAYSGTVATPTITLSPTSLASGTYNTAYSQTVSASGGIAAYTYAVTTGSLPTGITLNSSTGAISGTPTTSGTFPFTITATDAYSYTGSQAYSLTIAAPTITLSPTTISPIYGSAFSQTLTASGGVASYTFAVTSGSLPGGLSLNSSTGAITGTPSATGAYSFTITATDAHSQTGNHAYSGTISTPTITLSPASPLTAGTQNSAYSQTLTASGGIAPYTYAVTSGSLPAGLSLSSSGVLSGTPTAVGTSSFTVTATDAHSYTGSQAYSLTVSSPNLTATFVGGAASNGNLSVNLGTGSSDLYVVVAVVEHNGSPNSPPPSSVSVGGVSLTQLVYWNATVNETNDVSYWGGYVTAGGTKTVSFSVTNSSGYAAGVWVIRGDATGMSLYASSPAPNPYDSYTCNSTSVSATISVPAGGVILAGGYSGGTGVTFNGWTGVSLGGTYFDGNYNFPFAQYAASSANSSFGLGFSISPAGYCIAFGSISLKGS